MKSLLTITLITLVSCGNPHLKPEQSLVDNTSDFQQMVYEFDSEIGTSIGEVEHEFVSVDSEELFFDKVGVLIINTNVWNKNTKIENEIEVYRVLADGYLKRPETEIATLPGKIECPRSLMHPKMVKFGKCFVENREYYIDELKNGEDLRDLK